MVGVYLIPMNLKKARDHDLRGWVDATEQTIAWWQERAKTKPLTELEARWVGGLPNRIAFLEKEIRWRATRDQDCPFR